MHYLGSANQQEAAGWVLGPGLVGSDEDYLWACAHRLLRKVKHSSILFFQKSFNMYYGESCTEKIKNRLRYPAPSP